MNRNGLKSQVKVQTKRKACSQFLFLISNIERLTLVLHFPFLFSRSWQDLPGVSELGGQGEHVPTHYFA